MTPSSARSMPGNTVHGSPSHPSPVGRAHLAGGPSLRRVVLSTSITATMPSSDFRSTLHHFTGSPLIGFAATEHRRAATCGHNAGAETDLSCSVMSCTTVPPSIRRRVPGCCTSKVFTPSMAFAPVVRARLPLCPLASRGRLTTLQGSLDAADRLLARPPKGLCCDASTVGSPLPPATSYSAAWSLRWPDSHRQVHHRFQDTREVGSRRGGSAPFPAPPSQTGHEVLPHPAFPQAVGPPHSTKPPVLATSPSTRTRFSGERIRGRIAVHGSPSHPSPVGRAHLAGGPSLRRVVLSTSITATMPSSDFRSTLHHFTGSPLIGFAATEHRSAATCGHNAGAETDLSCSVMSCTTVPPSIRRRVPGCCTSKVFTPSMAFAPVVRARLPLFPLASRGRLTTLQGSLDAADRLLARPPKGLCCDASTVGSPLPPATSYSAAWSLRWPDSHRQVHHRFQDTHYGRLRRPPGSLPLPELLTGYRSPAPTDSRSRSGRGGPLQFPPSLSERSAPPTPGSSSRLRFQDLRRFHGLRPDTPGSALPCPTLTMGIFTTRQASLDATDRSVAPPLKGF